MTTIQTLSEILLAQEPAEDVIANLVIGSQGFTLQESEDIKTTVTNGRVEVKYYDVNIVIDKDGLSIINPLNEMECSLSLDKGLVVSTGRTGFGAVLRSSLITRSFKSFEFPNQSGTLLVATNQVFENNSIALANGLVVGEIYRTDNGQLMIVY